MGEPHDADREEERAAASLLHRASAAHSALAHPPEAIRRIHFNKGLGLWYTLLVVRPLLTAARIAGRSSAAGSVSRHCNCAVWRVRCAAVPTSVSFQSEIEPSSGCGHAGALSWLLGTFYQTSIGLRGRNGV